MTDSYYLTTDSNLQAMRWLIYQQGESEYGNYIVSMIQEYAEWLHYDWQPLHDNNSNLHVIFYHQATNGNALSRYLSDTRITQQIKKRELSLVIYIDCLKSLHGKTPAIAFVSNETKSANGQVNIPVYCAMPSLHKALDKEKPVPTNVFPYLFSDTFRVLEWQDKLLARSGVTGNSEFFVSCIDARNEEAVVLLLKSFAHFKKWQQSGMPLLLIQVGDGNTSDLRNKLSTFKYRNDVELVELAGEKSLAGLLGSAYAYLHSPMILPGQITYALAALKCGTPVISIQHGMLEQYMEANDLDTDCVLTSSGTTVADIGKILIDLYKNEALRTDMSNLAIKNFQHADAKNGRRMLWEILEKTTKNKY